MMHYTQYIHDGNCEYINGCLCDECNFGGNSDSDSEDVEEDGTHLNSLHDKCNELCDTFQIPDEYKKIAHSKSFNDDYLIREYKKLNDTEYFFDKKYLISVIMYQLEMIEKQRNDKLKKIRFLILVEFMSIKKIRELITSNNISNDVISNKIRQILLENQKEQEFVKHVTNNLTFNI